MSAKVEWLGALAILLCGRAIAAPAPQAETEAGQGAGSRAADGETKITNRYPRAGRLRGT